MATPFPPGPAAVLAALQLNRPSGAGIPELREEDWLAAAAYADRNRITLQWYAAIAGESLPGWVRERLEKNAAGNAARLELLLHLHRDLRAAFARSGVEHLVLKGPAQWPLFAADLQFRTQYDLDLFCPAASLDGAMAAVRELGYEPLEELRVFPTDHLPVMIRKTGWKWRGDFFDAEMPIAVELHFRFWDRETERFGPEDLTPFWERRVERDGPDGPITTLGREDALAYTCLHALRHLLRGDSKPLHLYEVAWFLDRQREDGFWNRWRELHDPALRQMQAICFQLARKWFACGMHSEAEAALAELPGPVRQWGERWGRSPLEGPFRPNKDEVWLHLSLLPSGADQFAVLRRRLIPLRPPGPVGAVHIPAAERGTAQKLRDAWSYARFVSQRFAHHARVLGPAAGMGIRWWFAGQEIGAGYWRFYRASMLYNSALFIFYLLYNLYLAGTGLREDVLGMVAGFMAAGSLFGSFAATPLVARLGLRRSLIACFVATGVVMALRVLLLGNLWLFSFAFLGGVCQALWAVCLSPTVAQLTTERNRSFVFSLTFSSAIALGMAAGAIGGWLPVVLGSTRNAIWFGCALAPLAALPLLRLRVESKVEAKQFFRPNPFLLRFLAALAVWGLATGALGPFFNVYFAKVVRMTTVQIGLIFSVSQFTQVVAMLSAPLILRRFGLVAGIALMQAGTAICMATLGVAPGMLLGLIYCGYTAFHYMSEPGLYSLLMKGVPEEARTSASAWNFVVVYATHAAAAAVAGQVIAKAGYTPVLLSAAGLTMLAAFLFFTLLRDRVPQ